MSINLRSQLIKIKAKVARTPIVTVSKTVILCPCSSILLHWLEHWLLCFFTFPSLPCPTIEVTKWHGMFKQSAMQYQWRSWERQRTPTWIISALWEMLRMSRSRGANIKESSSSICGVCYLCQVLYLVLRTYCLPRIHCGFVLFTLAMLPYLVYMVWHMEHRTLSVLVKHSTNCAIVQIHHLSGSSQPSIKADVIFPFADDIWDSKKYCTFPKPYHREISGQGWIGLSLSLWGWQFISMDMITVQCLEQLSLPW